MLKLIIGLKGSGKTKQLIELANKAVEVSPGNVVCLEKSNKLTFDVNHKVRLIDTETYGVNGADQLYGMVCGILATNYDVKDLFIDSALKICNDDIAAFEKFIDAVDALSTKLNIGVVMTSSVPVENATETMKKYI